MEKSHNRVPNGEGAPHTYFGDKIAAFSNGAQLDLRVKLAIELLKSGAYDASEFTPVELATHALDTTSVLLGIAAERGLLKDLPDDDELTRHDRNQLCRQVRAQMVMQLAAAKIGPEEQHRIQVVPPGPMMPGRGILG